MTRPHIEPFVETNVPWKRMTLPGFGKGMRYKVLSLDSDTGACSLKVLFEPGYKQPPGMSYSVKLGVPKPFYDESHRPAHFLDFAAMEDAEPEADREDPFA